MQAFRRLYHASALMVFLTKTNGQSPEEKSFHTIVIGGGVMGASTAWKLQEYFTKDKVETEKEKKVLLIEQFYRNHKYGSSHGDGRIARLAYPEDFYVLLMKRSFELWHNLEKQTNTTLVKYIGSLDFGPKGCIQLQELIQTYQHLQIPYQVLTPEESNKKFPQFTIDSESEAIFQPNGAVVYADKAVHAFWSTLKYTMSGDEVVGIKLPNKDNKKTEDKSSPPIEITLRSGQKVYCEKLVVAAGSWTNQLLELANVSKLPLQVSNEQGTYYEPKKNIRSSKA